MPENLDLLARAAAGDQAARDAATPLIWRAMEGYFRSSAEMPLERFMGLPVGGARREIYKYRRNYWLAMAHGLCDGSTPWKKSVRLAEEIERFLSILWPTWQAEGAPPGGCSDLRYALFNAMQYASQIPTAKGTPSMPATANMLHLIVKSKPSDIEQADGEDEGSNNRFGE